MKNSKMLIIVLSFALLVSFVFIFSTDEPAIVTEGLPVKPEPIVINKKPLEEVQPSARVEVNPEIEPPEEVEEDLSLLPSIGTECYTYPKRGPNRKNYCKELVKVTYLENGDLWKKHYRLENGRITTEQFNYIDGYENGWNIKPNKHEYWEHDRETLAIMSEQGDRDAQLILAHKYMDVLNNPNLEEGRKHALLAAKNGYTSAISLLASSYRKEEPAKQRAYFIIGSRHIPRAMESHYEIRMNSNKWSDEDMERSEQLVDKLEKEIFNHQN